MLYFRESGIGNRWRWYAADRGAARPLVSICENADVIDEADDNGATPLLRAVAREDLATVNAAIGAHASLNAVSHAGNTPLMLAASRHPEIVSLLLQHHADYTPRNKRSLTALMIAAQGGCGTCFDLLRQSGANPSRKDSRGRSALDMQARHATH